MPVLGPRTPGEGELVKRAFRLLPGGTLGNVYFPPEDAVIIRGGRGSHVWDVSGREYIDYLLGSGPMILGHAHPAVVQEVQEQLSKGSTFYATNEPIIALAEELVKAIPCAEKVRFFTSGSEATFFAMRLARAYRRRDKVLKFEGGFHGTNDYAMMSTFPKELRPFPKAEASSAGIPAAVQEQVLIAPFNDLETTSTIVKRHREELAAVILEPFQRVIPPKTGFLQGLRELTREYQLPLIFDEVVTGFRFAYGGAQEFYGVVPDLGVFGKIIGGGFPLAAVVGREEIMDLLDPAREGRDDFIPYIGTLSGNPVAAVAGLATLRELQKPATYQRLFSTGRRVRDGLSDLLRRAELPAQVVGEPPLFDIYFTQEPILDHRSTLKADVKLLKQFHAQLLRRGIFKALQKFYISLAHTEEDVRLTLEAFQEAIEALERTR